MSAVYLSSLDPTFWFATQEFSMVKSSETTKLSNLGSGHLHRAWRLPETIWYRWIWPKPGSDNHEHFECNQSWTGTKIHCFPTPYSGHKYVNDIHVEWLLARLGLSKPLTARARRGPTLSDVIYINLWSWLSANLHPLFQEWLLGIRSF